MPEERRTGKPSRRRGSGFERSEARSASAFLAPDRRRTDRNLGRLLRTGDPVDVRDLSYDRPQIIPGPDYNVDRRVHEEGNLGVERRISKLARRAGVERRYGAGRRSGDLANALETGESVIFDLSKSKSVLKKVAKKAGTLGLVLGVAGFAKEAKAMGTIDSTKGRFKGEKSILPPKPKVK